jgi:hypothetical protein
MIVLRILRNFAVLAVLAVAILSSRPTSADQKECLREGEQCPPQFGHCCPGLVCSAASDRAFCVPADPR